tara:strand:+ start:584 stop:718 length:135 start_codon:yes stop_codon:yes gene_type:complete
MAVHYQAVAVFYLIQVVRDWCKAVLEELVAVVVAAKTKATPHHL